MVAVTSNEDEALCHADQKAAMPPVPAPAPDLLRRWTDFYRRAHAHPELAHAETWTTQVIEDELDRLGIEHFRVSATGTVGLLRHPSHPDGPVVAFRADIDGLPVTEATGLPHASTERAVYDGAEVGVMHACGHDAHFSSLLGAAEHLLAHPEAWRGTVVLVFQPAEEAGNGAQAMVDGGLWEKAPRPEVVLGQHVGPAPTGMIATRAGHVLSLSDTLWVRVHGTQSHGSRPQDGIDPVLATAQAVVALQTVVTREVDPGAGVVVTVGTLKAGTAPNIIPESAEFSVNIRTPDPEKREVVVAAVKRILDGVATTSRARFEITSHDSFSRCWNDEEATATALAALREEFGAQSVLEMDAPATGSEDVGTLADSIGVPLVYWFFGSIPLERFGDGSVIAVNHSPEFAPDAALAVETGVRAATAALVAHLR